VDPRHNADALELLVRDLDNVGRFFADAGAAVVDSQAHALALWHKHVDPQR
jgi:serine/threonine-protein kinase RIO1